MEIKQKNLELWLSGSYMKDLDKRINAADQNCDAETSMLQPRCRGINDPQEGLTSARVDAVSSVMSELALGRTIPDKEGTKVKRIKNQAQERKKATMCANSETSPCSMHSSVASQRDHAVPLQQMALVRNGIYLTELVGVGGQGQVFRGFCEKQGVITQFCVPVAVKVVKKHPDGESEDDWETLNLHVRREVEVLKAINHPNCLKLYGLIEDQTNYYLVTEFIKGHDLYELAVIREFDELEILDIALQLVDALEYLHSHGVCHRDIKLENVLLTQTPGELKEGTSMRVKLIDYGYAYFEKFDQKQFRPSDTPGTSRYRCPEMLDGRCDPRKADLWSLGVLLYCLAMREYPFDGESDDEIYSLVLAKEENYSQPQWQYFSHETKMLIRALLSKSPENRPTAAQTKTQIQRIRADLVQRSSEASEAPQRRSVRAMIKAKLGKRRGMMKRFAE